VDLELGKGEKEVQRDCNSNDGLKCITPGNSPISMVLQLLVGNLALKNFFISGEFEEDQKLCIMMKSFFTSMYRNLIVLMKNAVKVDEFAKYLDAKTKELEP
jgi:hypothetical protein